ncbi:MULTISPECIES: nicotinamide riboside transporter PnuC [unclassified Legionella]|uniref:nicotinamide riboside transporter PnuC n=1 Tax=unclassified Legionella TaxID=2622702 RepID=UPI0010560B04|nr:MULTISPECIES: nicotinamide riboside transporter PnuC [unclassified Legionella]MDI9817718.1 nicotinamide riboside transporter PnuC [Legionella sp. PL877]
MLLDIVGALASLLATYYFIRLTSKAWPVSLLAICLNSWLYWQKGIYADMLLELFYFLSTCYGWYLWRSPAEKRNVNANLQPSKKQWLLLVSFIVFLFVIILNLLLTFTNSNIATLDSLTATLSLAAQWLLCHKMIATWVLWFITDAIYAYIYFHKQIPFHGILMLIYMVMAVIGYLTWATQAKSRPNQKSKISKNLLADRS